VSFYFPGGSVSSRNEIKGGQIIILLNFLVKITNIAYFWPFKGVLYPPYPPLVEALGGALPFKKRKQVLFFIGNL
jgi:hypothetical protein